MTDEIKELREEVAKLRERVAVLEARPVLAPVPSIFPMQQQQWPPYQQPYVLPTVTCTTSDGNQK